MPTQYSKFVIDATCHEYVHPWTKSCISSTAGLGLKGIEESFRIYTTVYLLTLLMKRKKPTKDELKKTFLGILQSTAFLSWSTFTFSMFLCLCRRILGNFNALTVAFIPAALSSLSAIVIERPSRRPMLCLYVSNIATETLFRMGLWRGWYTSVPHGNAYIFSASIAALLYLYRTTGASRDSIFKIVKYIASPYEEVNGARREVRQREEERLRSDGAKGGLIKDALRAYQRLISFVKGYSRHSSCPHPFSCLHFVLGGGVKLFGIGLSLQIGLNIALQFRKLITRPYLLKSAIFKKKNINLAVFLGGCTTIYRLISCSLRRICNGDDPLHAVPAGLLAGLTFVMFPNNTIALYVMWKALQLLWNKGVEDKKLPEVKWFVIALYCFSTAVLFHAALVEPQNLRSSYFKFLYNLSGGRLASMNRIPLDAFGLETSRYLKEVLVKTKTTDQHHYSF